MGVIRKTLEENYIFFVRELARLDGEIRRLPPGGVSPKKIGGDIYFYHQRRIGKKVVSVSLGKKAPPALFEGIARRKILERQRREVMENLSVISRAIDTQRVTAEEVLKQFHRHGIRVVLIGSYVLPFVRDGLGYNLPTIKTQDMDVLVQTPYRGKAADIEAILGPLGFSAGTRPDGSTFFSNGVFAVEFLTPEKGRGTRGPVRVAPIKAKAVALRYLQMLFDEPILIEREGYSVIVPSPWVFAFHKILVSGKRQAVAKKDKDLLQALALLREIFKDPLSTRRARAYFESLPGKWRRDIRRCLARHLPDAPILQP